MSGDGNATHGVDLLRRSFEELNRGGIDAAAEFVAPDFIANVLGAPAPTHGRDVWKQNALMLFGAFPDIHADIDDIFGAGDRVAVRLTFRGTHTEDFLGIPATGREVSFTSIELYRVDGDQLAEEWVSPDIATLMAQISAP